MKNRIAVVSFFIAGAVGAATGAIVMATKKNKVLNNKLDLLDKMGEFYNLLIEWLKIHQEGKTLVSYFEKNNYKTVAIYGMKELGERLFEEFKASEIEVKYAIDKNSDVYAEVEVLNTEDALPAVDVIVVTAIHYYDEIKEMLSKRTQCPIVSLEDIIYEI